MLSLCVRIVLFPPFSLGNSRRCVAGRTSFKFEFVLLTMVSFCFVEDEPLSSLLHEEHKVKASKVRVKMLLLSSLLFIVSGCVLALLEDASFLECESASKRICNYVCSHFICL